MQQVLHPQTQMSQSTQVHSYGPSCQLAQHVVMTGSKGDDDIPALKCQFFYASRIGIDDPLSAVPVPTSKSKSTDHPPRPFSAYDNCALDYAWMGFSASAKGGQRHKETQSTPSAVRKNTVATFGDIHPEQEELAAKAAGLKPLDGGPDSMLAQELGYRRNTHGDELNPDDSVKPTSSEGIYFENADLEWKDKSPPRKTRKSDSKGKGIAQRTAKDDSLEDLAKDLSRSSTANYEHNRDSSVRSNLLDARADGIIDPESNQHFKVIDDHTTAEKLPASVPQFHGKNSSSVLRSEGKENKSGKRPRSWSRQRDVSPIPIQETDPASIESHNLPAPNSDTTITGRPFLRLPSRRGRQPSPQREVSPPELDPGKESEDSEQETVKIPGCKAQNSIKEHVDISVGVSRLHHVQLPSLQMRPIYWSPAHDIAAVTRGTWFYIDTMYPVEPLVANQLELGYRELRPWSETWSDELRSAIDVGAAAEEKISHQLWPKEDEDKSSTRKKYKHTLSADPYCAAKCFNGEAAAEGATDWEDVDPKLPTNVKALTRKYANFQVIYKDAESAFILKPTLQPSAYYGRKPLQKIKRGQTVGIHVVRGFDWKIWEKLHPSKKSYGAARAEDIAPVGVDNGSNKPNECKACRHEEGRPKVTDVVFVIHGIGQKLSERMESFNFTHAINGFRRSVNLEMSQREVQKVLRDNLGGIMVLPINWRTNLSFEDGGTMKEEDKKTSTPDHFTLDDITPTTIPAVRNMISDVMLDIPFYMSHHKPKMIQAVIAEANRVYRLWCQNNPDFSKEGRVHIIAHSLGSAMAIDVLSKQPTNVAKFNPSSETVNHMHFDFNTTNLFLAGSPAGFFLYLEKAMLVPRKGQNKADVEAGDDSDKNLVGEAGRFGCLAVDNIYNIMHYNDPIAYRMNAAVDPQYAASLKNSQVPNATIGFFESIGNVVRYKKTSTDPSAVKPPGITRLPSQLEMAVHDFTREEIAEKKFNLLNDNGQIDWFLSSGGGPLEIQYINMLGAHSSYWESQDFIRFIVVEVGRKAGKSFALPHMRAVKAGAIKVGQKS